MAKFILKPKRFYFYRNDDNANMNRRIENRLSAHK
jgi:hypothetical protein